MISNSSLKDIGRMLMEAETILLFPHTSPDGDAIGSCAVSYTHLDVYKRQVYPACGSSNSAIGMSLEELEKTTGYEKWVDVCKII